MWGHTGPTLAVPFGPLFDQFVGGREERFRRLDAERPRRQAGGIPHLQQRSLGLCNIAGIDQHGYLPA
ncbi:MAG TPA: hypothetical protein VHS97_14035 [Isosphaeraceae bacterium]|nr:hypothetical protein [Isosphaeraceae bacterium]